MTTITNKYIFSGHESFPCKNLWLKKGYDFVVKGKNFNNADSVIHLGVGKNMVSSIRYWLKAFDIYKDNNITWLGNYLFNDIYGKDKYIEDLATLWLLHFNLVFTKEASIYNMIFCGLQMERTKFERDQITSYILIKLIQNGKQSIFNENTVKKDIGVLLLNYLTPKKPQSNEDFSSLLIDLNLIRQDSEMNNYYFNVDGKREVTKEIFLYALLKLREQEGDNSISFDTIQYNIGLIFCMRDYETVKMLKLLSRSYNKYLNYSDIAGVKQVQFTEDLSYKKVLDNYYEKNI